MKRKLVFWTAFNSYQSSKLLRNKSTDAIHPVQTKDWTRKRTELFMEYNLKSILNQSYDDFLYILLLDPELKHITKPLLPRCPDERIIYCYKDRPVLERLKEHDEIIFALVDNDDMYSDKAGELMMGCQTEWMYFKKGYALDIKNNNLYHYDTIGSGPFFAHRLDPKTMIRFDRDKRHPTHVAVIHKGPERLEDGNFCVLLHDINTSSVINMRRVLDERADMRILKRKFGQ